MTSCWISDVPSKIVWINRPESGSSSSHRRVPLSRVGTCVSVASGCVVRPGLGTRLGMLHSSSVDADTSFGVDWDPTETTLTVTPACPPRQVARPRAVMTTDDRVGLTVSRCPPSQPPGGQAVLRARALVARLAGALAPAAGALRAVGCRPRAALAASTLASRAARYLSVGGLNSTVGMPPRSRNQRLPTGPDTPHPIAASSLVSLGDLAPERSLHSSTSRRSTRRSQRRPPRQRHHPPRPSAHHLSRCCHDR